MKLIEKRICLDNEGRLQLPMEFINVAALQPGAELTVTLAIPEEGLLPCPVMVVSPDAPVAFAFAPDCGEDEEPEDDFALPHELLNAAGIPIDSDLDVSCVPGAIIIKESDIMNRLPDGLRTLFNSFGIHPETVRDVMKKEGYFV
ncbi:MAG: hypothetical protein M0T74_07735 [Desulfitobacterium hafniense]|nr:hypothetical protein [Desulfitobacterium hafniense]